jgi:hypothetical protein
MRVAVAISPRATSPADTEPMKIVARLVDSVIAAARAPCRVKCSVVTNATALGRGVAPPAPVLAIRPQKRVQADKHGLHARMTCPSYRARRGGRRSPRHGRRAGVRGWRANSAGKAAPHLAKSDARVTLLVRGEPLAASMSDYLITQLKATLNIEVRLRTRAAGGHGQARLEALTLEDVRTGQRNRSPPRPSS